MRASVMKAKNLMAKDANGYSDPYCMLGILLGQSPRDTEEKKERKFSFRKRKEKLEKRSSTKEVLPARCIQVIQVTEVKPETLNPVWDEHFVFAAQCPQSCRRITEASDVYFKQIAKSVRSNGSASSGSEENADDFLGCTNIPLNRDTALSKSDSNVSIHKKLLSQIIEYEHREPYNWNGRVCPPAWTVLTHHAVQTDLSPLQQAVIRWQCYSSHHRTQRVCYSLLLRLLRTVDAEWDPTAVRGDLVGGPSCVQERQLSDSFRLYTEHCLCLMKNMRQVFPCTSAAAITRYELMLRTCVSSLNRDAKMLALTGFHNWFKSSIHKWLQIVHDRSGDRIRKAVETDTLEPVQQAKHSSSAVEVATCFGQVREIWLQLAWPDSAGAFIFVTRLTDVSAAFRIDTEKKVERNQLGRDHKSFTVQLCIALNNTEHVRVFLGQLPRDLDWQGVERAMEESCGAEGKEQVYKALNGQLFNVDLDLQREAKRLITLLTDKMLPELRRYIQHISLSPDSINNDDAVSPLMKYLQDTMVILTENLVKENLTKVLQSMWELLLRMILDAVAENRGVQVEFYNRFQYTVEVSGSFLHAKGEGLSLEDMKSGDYKVLDEELRLNKCPSFELIEQYYLEKISQQKTLKHTRYGRISVKCYYDAPEQRLTVEMLHAADIIALDANGLSDPFVIVELCPHHLFPMAKSQRTQVKLKTLHPVFDELFSFHVSPEQYRHRFACLTFTVMDYDWLSTNDFAGEAVAPLSDFCWPGRPNASAAGKSVQPVILHLSRSKPSGTYRPPKALMLDARIGDKEAQEFVRRLKEIEKSMEEE
uniref:BAI1 associated protein 3 n=1 Tax=Cyclopterus lumpus TaxID=8103 RepID=A0A8C2X4C4_CYCLU